MGFRTGYRATVWDVRPVTPTLTSVKISTTRMGQKSGQFENDFVGYISMVGASNAEMATRLKPRDRIVLGQTDVTCRFDKEKQREYINYYCYDFQLYQNQGNQGNAQAYGGYPQGQMSHGSYNSYSQQNNPQNGNYSRHAGNYGVQGYNNAPQGGYAQAYQQQAPAFGTQQGQNGNSANAVHVAGQFTERTANNPQPNGSVDSGDVLVNEPEEELPF